MSAAVRRAGSACGFGADSNGALNTTLLALLPALACSSVVTGPGTLINLAVAAAVTTLVAGVARWAGLRSGDYRVALITAVILAFALPPAAPLWLTGMTALAAALFRLALSASGRQHQTEGVAYNTHPAERHAERTAQCFNPAMLGYAFVFLVFPHALSYSASDGSTGATALIAMAQRAPATISEIRSISPAFGHWGGNGAEWLGVAWMLGGLSLLWRRVITWHTPVGCIVGVCIAAGIGYEGDSAYGGATALHHLLSGGTLLIAWFVLTDPGTAPRQPIAQLLSGLSAGVLLYAVRESGGGADRSAFVVLLINALAAAFDVAALWLTARYNRHRQSPTTDAPPPQLHAEPSSLAPTTLPALSQARHALPPGIVLASALIVLLAVLISTVEARFTAPRSERLAAQQRSELQRLLFPADEHSAGQRAALRRDPHSALHLKQVTVRGYGGDIVLVLALDDRNCIRAIAALRHNETTDVGAPLLAASSSAGSAASASASASTSSSAQSAPSSAQSAPASRAGWLQQWRGACPIAVGSQAPDPIDNVTGATLTSHAVAGALTHWRRTRQ